jgi:membrane protein DedA with SNARE-associated domain
LVSKPLLSEGQSMHFLLLSITKYSYLEIFIVLGLGIVGLPVPDETLMAYIGFLISQGRLNYLYTLMAAFMGTSCGITIGYVLGMRLGNPFIKRYAAKMHVNPDDIQHAENFYNRYGKFALFVGYFMPGVRHLTAICAGASLMPYRTFALFAYTGGFLWTITLVSLGYYLGEKWRQIYMYSHRFMIPLVLLLIIVLILYRFFKKGKTRRD